MLLRFRKTLKSAQINGRKWIGIDQSEYAVRATINKLEAVGEDLFANKPEYDFEELEDSSASSPIPISAHTTLKHYV